MADIAPRYTFRALNAEGEVIAQSRGRAGALVKVLGALWEYRAAVERGSGRLYGDPRSMGDYSVDGVDRPFGAATYVDPDMAVDQLDRLGLARVAQITAKCEAEAA